MKSGGGGGGGGTITSYILTKHHMGEGIAVLAVVTKILS